MENRLYEAANRLVELLKTKHKSISTAESCTGGMVSRAITSVAGASGVFGLGICTYSEEMKIKLLNVPDDIIKKHTAVSSQTVTVMAEGVKSLSGSDYSLSVSGIAGPSGGTAENPVGTVWFGFAFGDKAISEKAFFTGNREEIRQQAAAFAIEKIIDIINGENYDTP